MFRNLIQFTAKVAIFAAVIVWFVLPQVPGMPKPGDFFHLPSWQDAVKFVADPADLVGKGNKLQDWVHSKMPNLKVAGYSFPKPAFAPPDILNKDKTDKEKAKAVLDPAGVLPKVF